MSLIQSRLAGLYQKQQLLGILVFSMVTIIVWVAISLITSQNKTALPPELQKLATPLTPTINKDVLDQIEAKQVYTEEDLADFPIYKTLTTSRSSRPSTATPSAQQTSSLGSLTSVELPSDETEDSSATPSAESSSRDSATVDSETEVPNNSDESINNSDTDEL